MITRDGTKSGRIHRRVAFRIGLAAACIISIGAIFTLAVRHRNAVHHLEDAGVRINYRSDDSWFARYRRQYELGRIESLELDRESVLNALTFVDQLAEHSEVELRFYALDPSNIPRLAEHRSALAVVRSVSIDFDTHLDIADEDLDGLANLGDELCLSRLAIASFGPGRNRISDRGVRSLTEFSHLKHLVLAGEIPGLTDEGVAQLASLHELESLMVAGMPISGSTLNRLAALPIRDLNLQETNVDDKAVMQISQFRHLESLGLTGTQVRGWGLTGLKDLPGLKRLYLGGTKITDNDIHGLSELSQLRELNLSACKITDASVEFLGKLTKLEDLDIVGTGITDSGIARLRDKIPELKIRHEDRL